MARRERKEVDQNGVTVRGLKSALDTGTPSNPGMSGWLAAEYDLGSGV
jgi:hypothetical protein